MNASIGYGPLDLYSAVDLFHGGQDSLQIVPKQNSMDLECQNRARAYNLFMQTLNLYIMYMHLNHLDGRNALMKSIMQIGEKFTKTSLATLENWFVLGVVFPKVTFSSSEL